MKAFYQQPGFDGAFISFVLPFCLLSGISFCLLIFLFKERIVLCNFKI